MIRTWTYWKLYPSSEKLDATVMLVRDLLSTIGCVDADWHFLRYRDSAGPHVRFRVFADVELADRLHAARSALDIRIRPDLYEPEIGKWGSAHAAMHAERVFTASSDLASRAIRSGQQVLCARELFFHTLQRLVPDDTIRGEVLRTHAAWWLGERDRNAERVDIEIERLRSDILSSSGRPDVLTSLPATPIPGLREFVDRLAATARSTVERPLIYLIHQHLHLSMNRLGLHPAQEAETALRVLARLEQQRQESG